MTKIAKILLVSIFIFSGLIKLNDPIGTQLKLEEYFEVFSVDFTFMAGFWKFWIPYALILSILLSSLEIVLASGTTIIIITFWSRCYYGKCTCLVVLPLTLSCVSTAFVRL